MTNVLKLETITGDYPVPSHGGPARSIETRLTLNGVVVMTRADRTEWRRPIDQITPNPDVAFYHEKLKAALGNVEAAAPDAVTIAAQTWVEARDLVWATWTRTTEAALLGVAIYTAVRKRAEAAVEAASVVPVDESTNEHMGDALAYAYEAKKHIETHNHREPGEFGDGATVVRGADLSQASERR